MEGEAIMFGNNKNDKKTIIQARCKSCRYFMKS